MKNSFFEYYAPTQDEYKKLWENGLIVFDTNVLLDMYRLPASSRDEFINILDLVKDKIWIPYQVALEFQKRRLFVISTERKATEGALSSAKEVMANLRKKVEALQMDKRGVNLDANPLLEKIEKANDELIKAIESVHTAQLDIAAEDPIRQRIDTILESRIGLGPESQEDLDALVSGGEARFNEKIPPGFADAEKDKNPNEATFVHNGIKYERKFGDLIIWRQIINHAVKLSVKFLIFVTADNKEDWWWREQGKTIGPHPELTREIRGSGGVELFWMYSSFQFMEHAKTYAQATVSKQSVEDLKGVIDLRPKGVDISHLYLMSNTRRAHETGSLGFYESVDPKAVEFSVFEWLNGRCDGEIIRNPSEFPDFVIDDGDGKHGYEVRYIKSFSQMIFPPQVIHSLLRGYLEVNEGRLSTFTLVIVISETDFIEAINAGRVDEIQRRSSQLMSRYPASAMIIGGLMDGRQFEPLVVCQRDGPRQEKK